MRAGTGIELVDLLPQTANALEEVLAGLAGEPKELPAKYFYDETGSALFERICETPEYYVTRAELELMERHAAAMGRFLGAGCELIEFGCGSGRKTRLLLEALQPLAFLPVDISRSALEGACIELAQRFPATRITPLLADYTRPITYPVSAGLAVQRRAVYFPGSTVGNFTREEAGQFLHHVRQLVGAGGALLIGVDLKKDKSILDAAYNDAAGVTAAFNLNLLVHLNRRFGADFDLDGFEHFAYYDEALGRIEMHLISKEAQRVSIAGRSFGFAAGELMRTEISCKYEVGEFQQMGCAAGFDPAEVWLDSQRRFAVIGFSAS